MKIRLFTIPNILTLANLACGALATIAIVGERDYKSAFLYVVIAAVFDFFDGFAARMLKQSSPLGGELDSLSDVVSFGLVPALVMMALFADSPKMIEGDCWAQYGYFLPLVIALFSSLRLAKFNIDEEQTCEFIGLPTPACALFCVSLGLLYTEGFVLSAELIALLSVVLALLLISPIRMFALKIKGFGWSGNELRYSFIIASVVMLIVLRRYALPLIIALYILLSTLLHFTCRGKK
ncbi:MAG: CDP-alcohol phosphatidyltransferase family protein [Rikenellaceae bacterium]